MKKGFTMIELIFVIVILGILAAVAIPRLAATRDDAEIVKLGTNLTTALSDIGAYYTSQGEFADSLDKMTNVPLSGVSGKKGSLDVVGKPCLTLTLVESTPNYIKIEKAGGSAPQCTKALDLQSIKQIMEAKVDINGTGNKVPGYAVGGIGVKF